MPLWEWIISTILFQPSASNEELEKDTYSTAIDYEIQAEDGVIFHLNKIQYNKIFSRISISTNKQPEQVPQHKVYRLIGKDSEGNSLQYDLLEGGNKRGFFESKGTPLSANCQWIELQLYEAKVPMHEDAGTQQDTIQVQPGFEDRIKMELSEVYSPDELAYVPTGEKVRILLK